MDESGEKARVIKEEGGDSDCIEEAIETCPDSCISWSA
jgi:ferredoxin